MKKPHYAIILSLASLVATPVFAEPAQPATVEKYLKLTHWENQASTMLQGMNDQLQKEAQQIITVVSNKAVSQFTPLEQQTTNELTLFLQDTILNLFNSQEFKNGMQKIIQENYTEKELKAYSKFLSTPEGQAIIKKEAIVTIQAMNFSENFVKNKIANDPTITAGLLKILDKISQKPDPSIKPVPRNPQPKPNAPK